MTKKPVKLTKDELKEMIQLESGSNSAEMAEGVFKKLFEDTKNELEKAQSKIDGRISRLIYGGFIATFFLLVALIFSSWLFMGSYQQNYLNTQAAFNEQVNSLREENNNLQLKLYNDIERLKEKLNYLERNLIERNNK